MSLQLMIIKWEQKGITVIELMIALSILLMALALGFNFFFFGVRAFDTGEQRTIVQNNVRLASRVITEELRFANQVEIYAATPAHQEGKRTICLTEDGLVIIRDEDGSEQPASGQLSSEVVFTELTFSISTEIDRIVYFSIGAEREGEQDYHLESEVAPLNQRLAIVDNTDGSTGVAVTYSVQHAGDIPKLSILPKLIAPGDNVEQVFELSLINDTFVDLNAVDIDLSGEAFSDLLNSDIAILSYSGATAEIRITGKFNEGIGIVTVLAAALEGSEDLSADVAVFPDYLFIVDDFLEDGIVGIAYSHTFTVIGGTEPYQFYMAENEDDIETELPLGLLLDYNTGTISGIPEEAVTDHEVFIGVTDADGDIHVREYSITIESRQYNLSIASVGAGTTDPPLGNYLYDYGEVVNIKAIPNPGAVFINWDGEIAEPDEEETTVSITGDKTVIANFSRVLMPLNEIDGGYYLKDESDNLYIKLTGNSYRVLQHEAGNTTGRYGDFNSANMPLKSELEGGVWNNEIRKEPANKPYWTNTSSGGGASNFFTVNASGILEAKHRNTSGIYLRAISIFTGYYVEENAGTLADPHILVDPNTL